MPIQYTGIMEEHAWTRSHAGLFDVSHMGQLLVSGEGAGAALEALLPADLAALKVGRTRYSLLLAEDGGIIDDLMVTRVGADAFQLVVNGATKHGDIAHLRHHIPDNVEVIHQTDRALLALQGPEAAAVLDGLLPGIDADTSFMQAVTREWQGEELHLTRSGYTGEDGFEISLPVAIAETFVTRLQEDKRVKPIGLGARDSLRLEAGLPLYGHDIDRTTDPVSAGLSFAISKRRREEGGFPGHARIARLLADGPTTRRVGLTLAGKLPAREGARVLSGERDVGTVTSGGHSPTLIHPIAMAYVDIEISAYGTEIAVEVRGKQLAARVAQLPFVPHHYRR